VSASASDRWLFLIPVGLAGVLVLMCAILVAVGHYEQEKAVAMRSWPSADATITHSELVAFRRSGSTRDEQRAETTYEYVVNGQRYELTQSEYAGYDTTGHEGLLQYGVGQHVRAYYDPQYPSDASLSNQSEGPTALFFVIGALLAVLSLPFLYLGLRMFRASRRQV